ncbi:MAG: hypothetical protein V4642_07555 [Bacteroidota bacterium]
MYSAKKITTHGQNTWVIPVAFFSILVVIITAVILHLNDGRFIYTLDDPYIHLALAENIIQGHYGVNLSEFSAPSSSILWPFLLAPFAQTTIGEYLPFIIAFGSCIAIIILFCSMLYGFAKRTFKSDILPRAAYYFIVAAGCAMPILVNLAGLTFIGMEHALQALCAIAVVAAFLKEYDEEVFPWWGIAGILIGPLVRYENAALSFLAIAVLFFQGRKQLAVVCFVFIISTLVAFSLFLHNLDLGFLPSSIVAKSRLQPRGVFPFSVIRSFASNLIKPQGLPFILGLILILLKIRVKEFRNIIILVAGAVLAHFAVGDILGRRYTAYMGVMLLLTVLFLYRDSIGEFLPHASQIMKAAVILFIVIATGTLIITETALTPIASNNLYEQQYQMHRLAKLYNKPVAINDLGFVSFRNNNYVLDLWGLASLKALKLRTNATSAEWPDTLCREHNAELVMIYDTWFPQVPTAWIRVGDITLSREKVAPDGKRVTFYAINQSAKTSIVPVLHRFKTMLPNRVKINIYE